MSDEWPEHYQCPECGSQCDRIEVDIGVGIQCSPWECYHCGWNKEYDEPYSKEFLDKIMKKEIESLIIPSEKLEKIAEKNQPSQEWYDSKENLEDYK